MTATKLTKQQETISHLHETQKKWFAVYTRFKSEKVVHRMLTTKNIEVYLPLQKVTRRYTRKIKHHEIPLISCYVFVKITKDEYVPVLETENVMRFIKFARNLYAIPDHEIDIIRRVTGEGEDVVAEPGSFNEGDLVEVIGGKLTGIRGRMVEKHGKKQVVVELESIGYSLRMTVDIALLQHLPK